MGGEDVFQSMDDLRLKPQLLYSVMASLFPEGKQPSPNPSELSSAVSVIRRHKLLSEEPLVGSDLAEAKQIESWKCAVDAWNERILLYASNKLVFENVRFFHLSPKLFSRDCIYSILKFIEHSLASILIPTRVDP
eukprot:Gb_24487 [translate_table: standard]